MDPILAQHIMSFSKDLVVLGMLPSIQTTQAPANTPIPSTSSKVSRTEGYDDFFCSLLSSIISGNEH